MAIVDPHVVERLIVARLQLASAAAVGPLKVEGEQVEEELRQWIMLGEIGLEREAGGKSAEDADYQKLTLDVLVHVVDVVGRAGGQAIPSAVAGELARVLDRANLGDPGTTHKVFIHSLKPLTLAAVDEARGLRVLQLRVEGQAVRESGETFETQIDPGP